MRRLIGLYAPRRTFSGAARVLYQKKTAEFFWNPAVFPAATALVWSEWRESNSRPLEPHSSALPNCATPGRTELSRISFSIIADGYTNVNPFSEKGAKMSAKCVLYCVPENKSSVDSCESTLLFVVELTGVEPVSEKKSVRVSPGAVCLLNFPWCGRTHAHYTAVAS